MKVSIILIFWFLSLFLQQYTHFSYSWIFAILLSVLRSLLILMMKTSCKMNYLFVYPVAVFSWIRESLKKLMVILLVMNSRVMYSGIVLTCIYKSVVLLEETISKVSLWSKVFFAITVCVFFLLTVCLVTELVVM